MPLFKGLSSKSTPKKAIDYITREDKAAFVSVRNLFEDEDYAEQFADTMRRFGKGKKFNERKYYHFKLSCARKDNVSPEQAHLYAQELAAILFPDDECVIATHTDTKTVHSHIIVNAVNPITGKKLRITESDYTKMKDEANRLGSEFGYTKTDFRKKAQNRRTTEESHIIMKGGTSWKCNSLIDKQNTLIKDLTTKVRALESENDYNVNRLSESVSSAVKEIRSLQAETRSLNNRVATETSQAIKRATTTLENELRKTIQTQSTEVFAEVKKELDESKKLLDSTREELRVERGFRKFLFWATPILLLAQTIAIILSAL